MDTSTTFDPTEIPEYYFSQYQGFIEETSPGSGLFHWAADPPSHISREVLRRRAEVHGAFWYQKRTGWAKVYTAMNRATSLLPGTEAHPVRFEREFDPSIYPSALAAYETLDPNTKYARRLKNWTNPDEVDYLIDKFLSWVKDNFNAEP